MMVHNLDPIFFDFGIIQIRWYSLAYIFGILIGWLYGKKILEKLVLQNHIKTYLSKYDDLITYIIIGVLVGGRIGYVLFYNFSFYLENIFEIVKIWKGGMSFHGGLVGVAISILIFSKKNNLDYMIYFDTVSTVAPIGLFFGRISNFINGELYGTPTLKPWGVVFPKIDSLARHPSQLYEALLEGILLFIILNLLIFLRKNSVGFISSVFLIFYGLFRVICEMFREPDNQIGLILNQFTMGQVLCIPMVIIGITIFKYALSNKQNV